jgi:polygalacturonase
MMRALCVWVFVIAVTVSGAPPPEPVFDVAHYGAKGDGQTDDRVSIQRAIDACKGSGGSVYLHDGVFLSGQIVLGSRMTLYVAPSATLRGIQSTSEADYPSKDAPFETHINATCRRRLIYGELLHDVAITGGGGIDGQGDFAPWRNGHGQKAMWTQVYLECTRVRLDHLTVDTGNVPGTRDGMDICDCQGVQIDSCRIRAQDDGICFKSGSSVGCRDIVVRNCAVDKLGNSAGNCIKFGTSSVGGLADVLCENLRLENTQNSAISWESVDGGAISRIVVRNCAVSNAGQVLSVMLGRRGNPPTRPGGSVSDVTFEQVTADKCRGPIACLVIGSPGLTVRNVRFVGLKLKLLGGESAVPKETKEYAGDYPEGTHFGALPAYGFFVRHADGVSFEDCTVSTERPDARPWLATEDVAHLTQRNIDAAVGQR